MKAKKLISLFLIFVMAFFVAVTPAYAEEPTAEATIATEEYKLLKALGMTHSTMDTLTENAEMTRAEFAYVIAKLMGYTKGSGYKCAEFWDVENEYYAEAIYYLRDLSVVSGVNEYMFKPNNPITYDEALSMAINALGYSRLAELKYGDYPSTARLMGNELDLTDGISAAFTQPLTAENAFKLLKNTALTTVMTNDGFSSSGEIIEAERDPDNTLLYTRHDILAKKGRMTDNGLATIDNSSSVGKSHVVIGGITLSRAKFTACKKYIGRTVDFYYNEDTEALLYCTPSKNADEILEIPAEYIATDSSNFSITNIPYYKTSKIIDNAAVKIGATAILNGRAYPAFTISDLKVDAGRLVLIDTDRNDIYDIILIERYRDYVVSSATNEILNTDTRQFLLEDMEEASAFDADGNTITFESIVRDSVVSVYESKDGEVLDVYAAAEKVTGSVESVYDNDFGRTVYTVSGTDYEISPSLKEKIDTPYNGFDSPALGESYDFLINAYGKIAHLEKNTDVPNYIAYCVGIASTSGIGGRVQAKLVMTDNEVFTPYFANKVNVNGTSGVKSADLIANGNEFFDAEGNPIRQPVKIKLNQDGDIVKIETAKLARNQTIKYDVDNFSLDRYYSETDYNNTYHALQDLGVSLDAVLFSDPHLATPADVTNPLLEDRISTSSSYETEDVIAYVGSNIPGGTIANIYVYEIGHSHETELLVCNMDVSYSENMSPMIVDTVKYAVNEDDETVKVISGFVGNTPFTYPEDEPGIVPDDVKQGDIACYAVKDGKIMFYSKLVSLADGADDPRFGKMFFKSGSQATSSSTSALDDQWINFYGYLYAVSDSALAVKLPGWNSTNTTKGGMLTDVVSAYRYIQYIIIYDKTNKEVYIGTPGELYTPSIPDADGNIDTNSAPKIFVYKRYNYARTVVMIKE